MHAKNDKQYITVKKLSVLAVLFIIGAGLFGWLLGRSNTPESTSDPTGTSQSSARGDVRSLVTYTLPDSWKEANCSNSVGSVFAIPTETETIDCGASPNSAIKISIDPTNSDDCNDLQNVQNVRKHICISLFINDKKSLKAETIYNEDSSYKKEMSVNAYYINSGKGIIKVEYIHSPNDNERQAALDQLAMSVKVK